MDGNRRHLSLRSGLPWHRNVTGDPPLPHPGRTGRTIDDVPVTLTRPPHSEIGLTIPVKIARHRNVTGDPPLLHPGRTGRTIDDVPVILTRPPHSEIGLTIPVKIAGHGTDT